MSKEIVLYHGSNIILEKPVYGKGNKNNDYGLGLYCTDSIDLAKEWAVKRDQDGYANIYTLNLNQLNILNISNLSVLYWITILIQNRTFESKNDISLFGKKYLIDHYSIDKSKYDIIIGYRADDSYFTFAEAFLSNTISVRRLNEALRLGNLGEQIVLISEKAFDQVKFTGYEIADHKIYYPLRKKRNDDARKEFLSNKQGLSQGNDLFLSDIIKGVNDNDTRI